MRLLVGLMACVCLAQTPVVVISIDTLRGDRLGVGTPNLDRWAAEGTVYENASTPVPLTLPAHTALMTSTYPWENGVESNAGSVPKGVTTLASVLAGRGYRTAAFVGSIFLEKQLGLNNGFATYDSPFDFGAFSKLSGEGFAAGSAKSARRAGPLVLRAANQWLASNPGGFLFVHLFDMHKPWAQGSYGSQLTSVDAMLGNFRQALEKAGWWDKALIVLVADHGEGLGDHGESDHGYFIYESTLHVPLILHWPKGDSSHPKRVPEPVGLVDVAPSILEYLKIAKPAGFHGRSFLDGSARGVFSASTYAASCFGWSTLRSVRVGSMKYIDAPRAELYDLKADPGEKRNLFAGRKEEAARMRGMLPHPASGKGAVSNKGAALRALGYIGPGPKALGGGADPKDRLPLLLRYEEALQMPATKRAAALRAILAVDGGNLLVRRDLGVALVELKRFAKAAEELRTVAGASPEDYVTRFELGTALEAMGRLQEARDQFQIACDAAPGAIQCSAALARVQGRL